MDERERLIVYLRYYKDQTQSEVADRLGISQVQVSQARKEDPSQYERKNESDLDQKKQIAVAWRFAFFVLETIMENSWMWRLKIEIYK